MKTFRTIILLIFFFLSHIISAQKQITAQSSVIDDFLEIPLPDTKVTLTTHDSVPITTLNVMKMVNGEGRVIGAQLFMTLTPGEKYLIHGTHEEYDDAWLAVDVPADATGGFYAGDLRLEKHFSRDLDEVTVKATKVKMFWKGDTIVYNADAFNLPAGSMLDDLIRQMPGVTMNDDGEIFVKGRKVDELLLGSKSFFRGRSEVLLKNLPYYTVKNIKVYDRQTELSEALGTDVEPKKYVMDVNLASEYNRGIIANAEVAGGTSDRYLGRAFVLGFDDPFRFSVVGNVNNVNETRHIGQSSSWTPEKMPKSQITTRSVAAELKYDNRKVEETLNADYTYTSSLLDKNRRSELFLDGMTPLSTLRSANRNGSHSLRIRNNLRIRKPWLGVELEYGHRSTHSRSEGLTEQRDTAPVSRITDFGYGDGRAWDLKGKISGGLSGRIKDLRAAFSYSFEAEHDDEESVSMRRYGFELPPANPLNNVNDYLERKTSGNIWLNCNLRTVDGLRLDIGEIVSMLRSRKRDFLYRPDSLYLPSQKDALEAITDFSNSYDSRYTMSTYLTALRLSRRGTLNPDGTLSIPMEYNIWEVGVAVNPSVRKLHYERGAVDTLVRNTTVLFRPDAEWNWYPTRSYGLQFKLSAYHSVEATSLYDMVDYRDDSTPLIVKLGNPDLKGNQSTYAEADFYRRGGHQGLIHAGASFMYFHRSTAQSVEYDPLTGTTTFRPVNVSGNYTAKAVFDMTRSFGPSNQWTVGDNTDAAFDNSVDHSMLQGEMESHLNRVRTLTLHNWLYVQFGKGSLNVRAAGDVRWRRSTGRMRDFQTLSAVDFQYGMSARYTIPVLNTTVSADGTMYSRRGYGSSALNTNDFVLNSSLSQSMMNGRLVARLEGFDLLHQLSQVQYEVNAQGRVETWYRSLPHYLMLHLVYNFNISPRKR